MDNFTPSDRSLKQNFVVIPNALEKVGLCTGYTYDLISSGKSKTGFIAQEVDSMGLPGITTTTDGKMYLDKSAMIPVLLEAIKELESRVKILEGS